MHEASYDGTAVQRNLTAELLRLRAQVDVSWSEEKRALTRIGLVDGMDVLEIGSGPGYVTERLLELLPHSPITCLEPSAELLEVARNCFGAHHPRVHFVQGTLNDYRADRSMHDFAFSRLVFQHLPDPWAAARTIWQLLVPGGICAVVDIDVAMLGIVEPAIPELDRIYRKAGSLHAAMGGDGTIGRRLWRFLYAAGFQSPRLEAFVYHSDELGVAAFQAQMDPGRIASAVDAGRISFEEYMFASLAFESFCKAADSYVLMTGLLAHGRKQITSP